MPISLFCHLRRSVFDQSSPVHPVSEYRGGKVTLSVTDERRTEILLTNIGLRGMVLRGCTSLA